MAELLIELFMEEIPARMQVRAADDFRKLVTDKLSAAGLSVGRTLAHSTPRRLALAIRDLPTRQADVREEKKGPRVGSPDQALQGFLRGAGLSDIAQAEIRDTGKGEFYFAVLERPGQDTINVLPAIIDSAIRELPWPKSMRWGANQFAWVRPLHSILALFDGQVVPGSLTLGTAEPAPESGNGNVCLAGEATRTAIRYGFTTRGHRFLAPGAIAVTGFDDYKAKLMSANVILDRDERKRLICEEAERLAALEGLVLKSDPGLLDEVAGLVEWPVAHMGRIDDAFMDVPAEVLTTSMRTHQRYFALETTEGALAPRFIVIANRQTLDGGAAVIAGNERVLRARLSDAKFFWDQDRKVKLEDRLPALRDITFHAKLGTLEERVQRIRKLSVEIARSTVFPEAMMAGLGQGELEMKADRAAQLCKSDLVTGVVGEFPEVQGIMGRYYALAEGEDAQVATAIADHYKPLGPTDTVPSDPVAVAVALAEKIDTLVGFFGIDEKPTGSRDPYALRRAALGVIRLVVENGLRLRLEPVVSSAYRSFIASFAVSGCAFRTLARVDSEGHASECSPVEVMTDYADNGFTVQPPIKDGEGPLTNLGRQAELVAYRLLPPSILAFFADRLKVALKEQGVRHDLIDAVFALGGQDDLVLLLKRVEALSGFVVSEDGANLLTAYRRAANILRIEEKKDNTSYTGGKIDITRLELPEEQALFGALNDTAAELETLLAAEDFAGAMKLLSGLRAPVDAFFDKVTVNVPDRDLRANRLRLLASIRDTLNTVADFSKIEG